MARRRCSLGACLMAEEEDAPVRLVGSLLFVPEHRLSAHLLQHVGELSLVPRVPPPRLVCVLPFRRASEFPRLCGSALPLQRVACLLRFSAVPVEVPLTVLLP